MSKIWEEIRAIECACCREVEAVRRTKERIERRLDRKMSKMYRILRSKYGAEWWKFHEDDVTDHITKTKDTLWKHYSKIVRDIETKYVSIIRTKVTFRRNLVVSAPRKDDLWSPCGRINRIIGDHAEVYFSGGEVEIVPLSSLNPHPLYTGYWLSDKFLRMPTLRALKIEAKELKRRYS